MQILLQDGHTGILLQLGHMQNLLCFRAEWTTKLTMTWIGEVKKFTMLLNGMHCEIYYDMECNLKFTIIWICFKKKKLQVPEFPTFGSGTLSLADP